MTIPAPGRSAISNLLHFPQLTSTESSDTRPPDWREREQALDTRASWIVEAPAGSGKTGLLIQRYLKLLADESIDEPEQVLAITFTTKATAELRERVLAQLESAATNAPSTTPFDQQTRILAEAVLHRDRITGWGLIERPARLKIRTIDAVCAEIARSLPILSGSGGRQSPTTDADRLYKEAARRTLQQLGGPDRPLHEALATILKHRDGNLANCEKLIAAMLGWRDQWGELVPLTGAHLDDTHLDTEILPRLERALDVAICQALTQLTQILPGNLLRDLTEAAAELAHLEGYKGDPSPIGFCADRRTPPEALAAHLDHWRALIHLILTPSSNTWRKSFNINHVGFKAEKHHKAHLGSLIDQLQDRDDVLQAVCRIGTLPPARYPNEQWQVTKALFRILSRALVELQLVFAETGECDFTEISLSARSALSRDHGPDELTAALGLETRHLLVDEMQDTSTSQYDLIQRLTQGWDGASQTVFLVGDPKQSIYRFRQARVERFVRTMHDLRLGDITIGSLRLTANFRSQRRLVAQFNEDFAQIFPREINIAHPEEVPYVEAHAIRPANLLSGLTWHTQNATDPAARRSLTRHNAQNIRKIAASWLARPLPPNRTAPWRIAVLVRSRTHLAPIIAEFNKHNIPFRALEIEELGERQEILDLLALTRALHHPADRVAWFAVLHAPWSGLGLADLHQLAGSDDPDLEETTIPGLIHQRGHLLSEDAEQRLARVWPILEAAASQRGRLPIAQWVERTWRSLGGNTYLAAAEQANALRFFRLLDELESQNEPIDLQTFKQRMKKLYAEPAIHPGAIDLMTIHGAKGLEWDAVILPALEKRSPPDKSRLLDWMEQDSSDTEAAHIILAPISGRGEESRALNKWIGSVHATREAAERKRLFYVACTRAREELHLFATPDLDSKGESAVAPNSLLKTAWPIAKPHFESAPAPRAIPVQPAILDLAASASEADPIGKPPILHRLPTGYDPSNRFTGAPRLPYGDPPGTAPSNHAERPEGSFAARSFGNAVHAFLELAANQIADGKSIPTLQSEVPAWSPRIETTLRADGLSPAIVSRLTQEIVRALQNTLNDPNGQWLLTPHPEAANEVSMTTSAERQANIRLDRTFRAGSAPQTTATTHQWVIDYKTGAPGTGSLEDFLAIERAKYQPQLEGYARILARHGSANLRLALYYPSIPHLMWWASESPQLAAE